MFTLSVKCNSVKTSSLKKSIYKNMEIIKDNVRIWKLYKVLLYIIDCSLDIF